MNGMWKKGQWGRKQERTVNEKRTGKQMNTKRKEKNNRCNKRESKIMDYKRNIKDVRIYESSERNWSRNNNSNK